MKVTSFVIVFLSGLAPITAFSSFADRMGGGGSAPAKKASYGPGGGKPYAPVKGSGMSSYLDNVAPPPPVAAAIPPPPPPPPAPPAVPPAASAPTTAVAAGDYLSSLKVAAPVSGAGLTGYLDVVGATGSPPTGGGQTGYLDVVGGGKRSTPKPATYGIGGGKTAFARPTGAPAAAAAAAPAPAATAGGSTMIAQEPVLTAINDLNANMVANQEATIAVLLDINASVKALAAKTI